MYIKTKCNYDYTQIKTKRDKTVTLTLQESQNSCEGKRDEFFAHTIYIPKVNEYLISYGFCCNACNCCFCQKGKQLATHSTIKYIYEMKASICMHVCCTFECYFACLPLWHICLLGHLYMYIFAL